MSNLFIMILGFASIANLLADFVESIDKKNDVPRKPFKCEKCLAYWISIIPLMYSFGWMGILYAAITSMAAAFIFKNISL